MTVGELLARMSSRELSEWMAFFTLEPWGCEVEDARAALIAATIANANRDPKKRRKPYSVSDFMPRYTTEPAEEPWEEQVAMLEQWQRAVNALRKGM